MSIPDLCQACHKYHHATVVNACPFCRDVQFPEEMLCDLVRDDDGDETAFLLHFHRLHHRFSGVNLRESVEQVGYPIPKAQKENRGDFCGER